MWAREPRPGRPPWPCGGLRDKPRRGHGAQGPRLCAPLPGALEPGPGHAAGRHLRQGNPCGQRSEGAGEQESQRLGGAAAGARREGAAGRGDLPVLPRGRGRGAFRARQRHGRAVAAGAEQGQGREARRGRGAVALERVAAGREPRRDAPLAVGRQGGAQPAEPPLGRVDPRDDLRARAVPPSALRHGARQRRALVRCGAAGRCRCGSGGRWYRRHPDGGRLLHRRRGLEPRHRGHPRRRRGGAKPHGAVDAPRGRRERPPRLREQRGPGRDPVHARPRPALLHDRQRHGRGALRQCLQRHDPLRREAHALRQGAHAARGAEHQVQALERRDVERAGAARSRPRRALQHG
mmetsp:Transcript_19302/g.58382  ORF Transcript_19302/g.58382 Transcript_19302/m.58382 type:complete len:350 (+) Transcript_19302:750-1799(+)